MRQMGMYTDNLAHLQGELLVLNVRLHRQILRWRATHHAQAAPEELLGLQISDREMDALLDGLYDSQAAPDADDLDRAPIATITAVLEDAEAHHASREAAAIDAGILLHLPELSESLGLDNFERRVVALTLAPEMDQRYIRLFKYLNDDVTRPWPSVDLALQLFCDDLSKRVARRDAFSLEGLLRSLRVVHLSEEAVPLPPTLLTCGMKLDDRIASFLLGNDEGDPKLRGLAHIHQRGPGGHILSQDSSASVAALKTYLERPPGPVPLVSIVSPDTEQQVEIAGYLVEVWRPGTRLLVIDGAALSTNDSPEDISKRVLREMRLRPAAIALRSANEMLRSPRSVAALRVLLETECNLPRFMLANQRWNLETVVDLPVLKLEMPAPDTQARKSLWEISLKGQASDVDLSDLADRFRLTTRQIAAAAGDAMAHAAAFGNGDGVRRADLFASSRAQSGNALEELGQRMESIHVWDDLVLPSPTKSQLLGLEHWVRYRRLVHDVWGFSHRIMLGRGLSVLFSGPSGTGKTMAAGIVARNLELDIYRIDLSTVVSKYIGETEKNLSRVFEAAEYANAILFFDEADALFGKRSEVKDAHDRYANIEVSYLLQRMEAYDGVAILCTNFRQNLDQAFARRMQITIEFPLPNVSDRERIWRKLLPDTVPQDEDVDLAYLARQFALTGGNIKNCVLTAAFAAAADGGPVSMRHFVQAVARELEKMNQPVVRSEFGRYYDLVRANA